MNILSSKSRVLVNVLGIPSILAIIYFGDELIFIPIFSLFVATITLLAIYEWHNLTKIKNVTIKNLDFISVSLCVLIFYMQYSFEFLLLLIIVHVILAIISEIFKSYSNPINDISLSSLGIIWIGVFIGSLVLIRGLEDGFTLTLMMILSIWICDTFAFVFGGSYGKKKIAPSISPNKTWFGSCAGFLGAFIVPFIVYYYFPLNAFSILDYVIFGLIFGILGQLGDLSISLLKREADIKDTSNILKGHGGILDRFDSLAFASPLFYIILYIRNLI
tara:strand:+ start:1550 stop:2374 length:825 start_codon:yes stop_codon:yes gene_type:complete